MNAPGVITTGAELPAMSAHEVDYAIVGSGAGGGTAAAVLAAAGAKVVVVEEGGHYTRSDFNMQESWAYPALYQEHGNRATDDLAIMILQGRNVGGGTTVNWTSSFRTPPATLRLWADRHGVRDVDAATLEPHFAAAEARLDVGPAIPTT
jgi:choline dehydrogenase-like flavoprotein